MSESPAVAPMPWWRYALVAAALVVCSVSQWYIFQKTEWFWSSWGLGLGSLLAAWALGKPPSLGILNRAWPAPAKQTRAQLLLGLSLVLPGMVIAGGGATLLSMSWQPMFEVGWVCVLWGVILWSYGLSRIDQRWRKPVAEIEWLRWERVAFLAILALGFFLRFYRYGDFPPPEGVVAVEEPQSGQGAIMILNGRRPWEFMLDRWLTVLGISAFGPTLTAIRIPFTLVSWLTIIPLYLLLRQLVSRPAALFATLLFCLCRWHLVYARAAHAIFGPSLAIILLVLYLCVHVYRYGGLARYPWIGLLSGLTLFSYAGYRASTAFVALFFAVSIAQHLWVWLRSTTAADVRAAVRRSLAGQLGGGALAIMALGLVAVPLYYQLSLNPVFFFEAAIRATDDDHYYTDNPEQYWNQRVNRIQSTAMMFNHFGDGSPTFNDPGAPQLDPVSGTLFVIGLAYCLIWGLHRFQGYFALYFLLVLVFGTVFVHNFDIRRLQGIIPFISIMTAFAVDQFGRVTRRRLGQPGKIVLIALAVVASALALADTWRVYFQTMMNSSMVRAAYHHSYTVGISYLHQMPDNGYMLLVSDMANFFHPSDFEWVRGKRIPGRASNDLMPIFAGDPAPWDGRELHVVVHDYFYEAHEIAELIRHRYPTAECGEYLHPDRPPYAVFVTCRIPVDATPSRFEGGIRARYYREGSTTPFLERDEPAISFALLPDVCRVPLAEAKPICWAEWEGTWNVEHGGEYVVNANIRRGELRVTIDDHKLHIPDHAASHTDQTLQTSVELEPGPHRVRVEARFTNREFIGARLRYRKSNEQRMSLVPFGSFAPP